MADPITAAFAAIGSAIASATAATATALTAIGVGAGAASSIAGALFSYNTLFSIGALAFSALVAPKVNVEGSPTEWRPDPYAGFPVVLGRAATAGSIIHMDEHGPDNRYLTIVNLLSAGPIQSIESFKADRVAVTFSGTGATSPSDYADKMWLSTSTGASATALTIGSLPHGSPSLQGWDSNSRLPGLAHTLWTLYQDSKFKSYPQGAPTPLHIIQGAKVYDPRKDSTYPGGSGSHRLDDPSTWEFSKNPGLHAIAWALGHKVTDPNTGKVFTIGIGCSASGIHWPAFVELANVCDANGWEVSAVPTSKDDKHQALKAILQAGGARYASHAGKISCIARTPRSSVVTVSARDAAGPFQVDVNADRLTRRNTITPRCVQEDHDWQMTAQAAVSVEEYVTADGGEIAQSLDFPYVAVNTGSANKAQPRQLAAYAMLDSRESIVGTVPFLPHMAQIEPGDVFTVNEPDWLLSNVPLLCLKRTINAMDNTVQIAFVSESAGKHDFALGRTNTPPTPPGLTAPDIRTVPAPEAGIFTATVGAGGQPAIILTASNIDATHTGYVVEFRTALDPSTGEAWADADAGWQVYGQYDIGTENVVLTGLEPETAYEVAIRYVSQFGIIGVRRVLASVTTGGMTATDATIPSEKIGAARDAINAARGELTENLEEANRTLEYAVTGLTQDAQRALQDARLGAQVSLLNRLTDPLFETGVDGWNAVGGAVLPVAGSPRALQAVWNIAEAGRPADQYLQWPVKWRVSEGDSVQVGAEVGLFGVSSDIVLEAVWIDASGAALSTSEIATGSSGRLEGVAQAPADSAEVTIRMAPVASEAGMGGFLVRRPLAASALPGQTTVDPFSAPENELVARLDRLERVVGNIAESARTLQVETRTGRASIRTNAQAIVTESEARTQLGVNLNATLQNNYLTAAQVGQTYLAKAGLENAFAGIDVSVNATLAGVIQTVNGLPADILTEAAAEQTFVAFANLEQSVAEIDLTANAAFNAVYTTVNGLPADILTEAAAEQTFLAIADLQQSVAGIDLSANAAFAATLAKVDGLPDTVYSQAAADAKFLASANLSTALSSIDFTTYASFNDNTSRVVRAASAPYIPDYKAGDIWINTSSGELRVHNGSGWDSTTLATLAYSNANFRTQSQVDSQISSFNFAALSYFNEMNAQVEINATAISDLEESAAQLNIVVAASGSTPATAELISGGGGSAVNLSATEIVLKTNTGGALKTALKGVDGRVEVPTELRIGTGGVVRVASGGSTDPMVLLGQWDTGWGFRCWDGSQWLVDLDPINGVFEINGATLSNATIDGLKMVDGAVGSVGRQLDDHHDFMTGTNASSTASFSIKTLTTTALETQSTDTVEVVVGWTMQGQAGAFNWLYYDVDILRGGTVIWTKEFTHKAGQSVNAVSQNQIGAGDSIPQVVTVTIEDATPASTSSATYALRIRPRLVSGAVVEGLNAGLASTIDIKDMSIIAKAYRSGPFEQ